MGCIEEMYIVWTLPDCPRCKAVVAWLRARRHEVGTIEIGSMAAGVHRADAMAALCLQDGQAPVVREPSGRFWSWSEIKRLSSACDGGACRVDLSAAGRGEEVLNG